MCDDILRLFARFSFAFTLSINAISKAEYMTSNPSTSHGELGAMPININIGAPNKIAAPLPVTKLSAAGVLNMGSISLSNSTPD